jgi:hypothetical protein
MATTIEPAVFALVGTVVGGLISFTTTTWAEWRRSREARAFRNHPERASTAMDYLVAFDNWRRCIRDNDSSTYVELSRLHAAAISRMSLFFDQSVIDAAEQANERLLEMRKMYSNEQVRKSKEDEAIKGRDETVREMRVQLGERTSLAHRNRRKFENNLLRLRATSDMWAKFEYPPKVTEKQRELLDAEEQRARQQIDDVTKELIHDLGFYALAYNGINLPMLHTSIPAMISRYVYAVRGVQLSNRLFTAKAKIIQELTVPIHTYLFGSRWHWWRRVHALIKLPKVLGKYKSVDTQSLCMQQKRSKRIRPMNNMADRLHSPRPPDRCWVLPGKITA